MSPLFLNEFWNQKEPWLDQQPCPADAYGTTVEFLSGQNLPTFCQVSSCHSRHLCLSNKTMIFLVFDHHSQWHQHPCYGLKKPLIPQETDIAGRIVQTVRHLGLKQVDLSFGRRDCFDNNGLGKIGQIARSIRRHLPDIRIELLIPDSKGYKKNNEPDTLAGFDAVRHNIGTVPRIHPLFFHQSRYQDSIDLLHHIKQVNPGVRLTSGLMLGLGERSEEINEALYDIHATGCRTLVLGRKLFEDKCRADGFVSRQEVLEWKKIAVEIGFEKVFSSPMIGGACYSEKRQQYKRKNQMTRYSK